MTIDKLAEAIQESWSQETSVSHKMFDPGNPAFGQCAVTALVVQDYLGGEIVNTVVTDPIDSATTSHYFNIISSKEIDLTRQQFAPNVSFSKPKSKTNGFNSTREYMLSFPSTVERYEMLKARVARKLQQDQ